MGACSPRGPPCLVWATSGPSVGHHAVLCSQEFTCAAQGKVQCGTWWSICAVCISGHIAQSHMEKIVFLCIAVHTGICRIVHCAGMKWLRGRPGGLTAGASLGAGSCHQTNTTTVSSPVHFCPVLSVPSALFPSPVHLSPVHSAILPSAQCALCKVYV